MPKGLKAYRGRTDMYRFNSRQDVAKHVVDEMKTYCIINNKSFLDCVVLVRLYSETPILERHLIESRIPYKVLGNVPFYKRQEIVSLLNYFKLGQLEHRVSKNSNSDDILDLAGLWAGISNNPPRYLPHTFVKSVGKQVVEKQMPLYDALNAVPFAANDSQSKSLFDFQTLLTWLSGPSLKMSASEAISILERRLQYKEFLVERSFFRDDGEAKAATIDSFIEYARNQGTTSELLRHIENLGSLDETDSRSEYLTLTTIFRAKGLQWPFVAIPHCNAGVFPIGRPDENIEESRRLMYVALTRPKDQLLLCYEANSPLSPFLEDAKCAGTLLKVEKLSRLLEKEPTNWSTTETLDVLLAPAIFGWSRFFETYWEASQTTKSKIAGKVLRLETLLTHDGQSVMTGEVTSKSLWSRMNPDNLRANHLEFPDAKAVRDRIMKR